MRSRSSVGLLALALVGGQVRGQDTRLGIAVFPFANGGSYGQEKENFDALERGMAGMLVSELTANPAARVVERERIQRLLEEQNVGAQGRVDPQAAARLGKVVGARYIVLGNFVDFYGDFRVDVRLVNAETGEILKTVSERMQRDHLFDIVRSVAQRLMKETSLPPLPKPVQEQRMSRQVPTEALTYYSRALLYQDRGEKDKAIDMFQRAVAVFPDYIEAQQGLERLRSS